MKSIAESLEDLKNRIRQAEKRFNRPLGSVLLLAVSKTRPSTDILAAAACGQMRFGENYLQEALPKIQELTVNGLEWHFIGHIQSNKTRLIAANFDWVHTIDREQIARRLSHQRPPSLPPLNLCIQVKLSKEPANSGVALDALPALAKLVSDLPRLRLRGLLALPAPTVEFEQQRLPFRELYRAHTKLNRAGIKMDTLSIGTTHDMEAAIAEGATMVRIGAAIFGPRSP
ncbi:MAG: YggS family pyridoxal phosphate-dependent enzyme [Gammaproteobacteria bacterium]